jgi:hypothetical protein
MHKIDINLDDEFEVECFIETWGTSKGRLLANALNLNGKGSNKAATALSNYAWNKWTAINCRKNGMINDALNYERICDKIYSEDISGKIECW